MTDAQLDALESQAEVLALQVEAMRRMIASVRPEDQAHEATPTRQAPEGLEQTLAGGMRFLNGDEHDV